MKYLMIITLILLNVSCSRMVVVTDRDTNTSIELYERDLNEFLILSNRNVVFTEGDLITDDDVM